MNIFKLTAEMVRPGMVWRDDGGYLFTVGGPAQSNITTGSTNDGVRVWNYAGTRTAGNAVEPTKGLTRLQVEVIKLALDESRPKPNRAVFGLSLATALGFAAKSIFDVVMNIKALVEQHGNPNPSSWPWLYIVLALVMFSVAIVGAWLVTENYLSQKNKKYPNHDLAMKHLNAMFPEEEAQSGLSGIAARTAPKARIADSPPDVRDSRAEEEAAEDEAGAQGEASGKRRR